ncbi:PorP/SprF family type IX secretion system membrane protein [Chondrinema litorale]|uniref:PorP/SprF family type IX secretion system membrane protein n=1 Tax=Chondrinema litorale TaxID=2994555 RepID=UPI0025429288|nr:type IX secretion system membrane protein PorP/SprF [Chondrinema litorale]UZR93392.1 type IX secretion system membrane protein PorP/SprF [Chondrinema litorale]
MNKLFILTILIFMSSAFANIMAQVKFHYTQYSYNPYIINPAYAGSSEALEMVASVRKQWMGIEGAPFSQVFAAHTPIKSKNLGIGLIIANDKVGVHNNYKISTSYAYRLKFKNGHTLSMGLQGGFYQQISDYTEIIQSLPNNSDPAFNEAGSKQMKATFGTGLFYYAKNFYYGLSLLNIETKEYFDNTQAFLSAGAVFNLSNNLVLQPAILIKADKDSDLTSDISTNFIFNDVLWLGVSYRTFSSFNFLSQIQVTPQIRFGYSYDTAPKELSNNLASGGHEIMLKYRFTFYRSRVITPRYF